MGISLIQRFGVLSSINLRDSEMTGMKQHYDLQGSNIDIVCLNEQQGSPAAGINQSISSVPYRVGNIRAMVVASTTTVNGLNSTFTSVRLASGPTAEYSNLILETFLAIDFQLLIRNPDSILDSDLDGVPDAQDKEPFNPNVR